MRRVERWLLGSVSTGGPSEEVAYELSIRDELVGRGDL